MLCFYALFSLPSFPVASKYLNHCSSQRCKFFILFYFLQYAINVIFPKWIHIYPKNLMSHRHFSLIYCLLTQLIFFKKRRNHIYFICQPHPSSSQRISQSQAYVESILMLSLYNTQLWLLVQHAKGCQRRFTTHIWTVFPLLKWC